MTREQDAAAFLVTVEERSRHLAATCNEVQSQSLN